jgi:hypothetical protein
LAQNVIDYVTSFVILIGVLVFAITSSIGVLNNYYVYQKNTQINGVATDLLNNLLQNTGFPDDWGRRSVDPTNFGLRWNYAQGNEPSPFAPIRLMNATSIFNYSGTSYAKIDFANTNILIKELDQIKYNRISTLLGTQGNYGWRISYKPMIDVNVEKTVGPSTDWYARDPITNTDWVYRKKITINALPLTSSLFNYPALIQLSDTDLKVHAQISGNDFVFTDSDTITKLSHEVESYDSSTGTLTAWVKIPELPSTGKDIYIYYGNLAVGNQEDTDLVWDSNYKIVTHMDDNPDSSKIADSANTPISFGTKFGMPTELNSKTAFGQSFDGVNDYIKLDTKTSGAEVTYEMWLKSTQKSTTQEILSDGIKSATVGFTDISRPASSDDLKFDYAPSDGWISRTTPPAGTIITSTASFKGNIYGGGLDGKLYQWNGLNSWSISTQKLGEEGIASLTVFNNKLYAGTTTNGKLYEYDVGYPSWIQKAPTMNIKCLITFNSKVYGGTDDGRLLEWDSINKKWVAVAPQFGTETSINSLVIFDSGTGNKLFAGTSPTGKLYQWNGVNAWVQAADHGTMTFTDVSSLCVASGKIYAGTKPGAILCSWVGGQTSWSLVQTAGTQTSIDSILKNTVSNIFNYSFSANSGSWTNGNNAVSSNDQYASHPPLTITGSPTSDSGTTWSSTTSAYSDGGGSASSTSNNDQRTYSFYGFTIPLGSIITQVRVRIDARCTTNDDIRLEVYDGSWHTSTPDPISLSTSETTYWRIVTSLSAGGWTPSEINNIQTRVTHVIDGSSVDTIYLDWIPVEVTYYSPPLSHTFTQFNIAPQETITKVEVGIEGFTSDDEKIELQVTWDGGVNWSPVSTYTLQRPTDGNTITYFDFTGATSWISSKLSNLNFQIRITDQYVGSTISTSNIDYLCVRITGGYDLLYVATSKTATNNLYVWAWVPSTSTWTQIITNSYPNESSVSSLVYYSNTLYGCTSPGGILVKQGTGGSSNQWVLAINPPGAQKITTLLTDGSTIYGGTTPNGYLYSSTGATWSAVVTTQYFNELSVLSLVFDSTGKIQAGTSPNGLLLERNGGVWTKSADTYNSEATIGSLQPFSGFLYGGTSPNGLLYQWDSANSKWLTKASMLESQSSINSLALFEGTLYGGTSPNGELFQWDASNSWIKKAGTLNGQTDILSMIEFNGNLLGGTSPGGRLFQWNNVGSWVQVAAQLPPETSIRSLANFNNILCGSTSPNGLLFNWDGASTWLKMVDQGYSQTTVNSLIVVGASLYGSTSPDGHLVEYLSFTGVRTVSNFFTGFNDQWVHLAIVADYNSKNVDVYRNGIYFASITATSMIQPASTPEYIGAFGTSSSFYSGMIDEYRATSGKRGSEWINTCFNNQNSPIVFRNIGVEEDGRLFLSVTVVGPSGPIEDAEVVLSLIHSVGSGPTLELYQENAAFGTTDIQGQVIIPPYAWTGSGIHLYLAIAKVTVGGMVCAGNLFEHQALPSVLPIITNYENGEITLVHNKDVDPGYAFDGAVTYRTALVIPVANDEYRPVLISPSTGVINTGAPVILNLGSVKNTPGAILLLYKTSDGSLSATLTPWDVGSLGLTATFGAKGTDATNIVTKYSYATIAGVSYEIKLELWKEGGF